MTDFNEPTAVNREVLVFCFAAFAAFKPATLELTIAATSAGTSVFLPVEPLMRDCPADLIASDMEMGTPLSGLRAGLIESPNLTIYYQYITVSRHNTLEKISIIYQTNSKTPGMQKV